MDIYRFPRLAIIVSWDIFKEIVRKYKSSNKNMKKALL